MDAFIKKQEYNYIKKCMIDLNNSFTGCIDKNVIAASKIYIQDKILNHFQNLSDNQKKILDISNFTTSLHIEEFLNDLDEYVYGMPVVTNAQINRLFKKEKKLKLPKADAQDLKHVYLGWIDNSVRKLFVAYNMNGKLLGMSCRITNPDNKSSHRCIFCNRMGKSDQIAFVSPLCKVSNPELGAYKSLGFDMCLDSEQCNSHIVSVDKLEDILKTVNNIK